MPISNSYKCIFIHIPKCAGTSIEAALGMHGELEFIGLEPYLNQEVNNETLFGKGAQHLTLCELKSKLEESVFQNYLKFTFVRNPWDRFVSHVAWKNWHSKKALSQDDVNQAVMKLGMTDHNHLDTQCSFLFDGQANTEIDFIGRFESLHNDWLKVTEMLNVNISLPSRMVSNHQHYSHYLTDEQAERIGDFYAEDIAAFGYKFERS